VRGTRILSPSCAARVTVASSLVARLGVLPLCTFLTRSTYQPPSVVNFGHRKAARITLRDHRGWHRSRPAVLPFRRSQA
jgi:hypothetical protein